MGLRNDARWAQPPRGPWWALHTWNETCPAVAAAASTQPADPRLHTTMRLLPGPAGSLAGQWTLPDTLQWAVGHQETADLLCHDALPSNK